MLLVFHCSPLKYRFFKSSILYFNLLAQYKPIYYYIFMFRMSRRINNGIHPKDVYLFIFFYYVLYKYNIYIILNSVILYGLRVANDDGVEKQISRFIIAPAVQRCIYNNTATPGCFLESDPTHRPTIIFQHTRQSRCSLNIRYILLYIARIRKLSRKCTVMLLLLWCVDRLEDFVDVHFVIFKYLTTR